MAAGQIERGVPLSTLSPKYLHTNSTSHTWAFSAIAELIDNAYDPDVNAKQIWIDKTQIKNEDCLILMDNGNGLNYKMMHKMLSFGYSDKTAVGGVEPIGIYGNGFKSGAMRLGRDALVFSKSKDAFCVGMLSQTYLDKTNAQQINVPIVVFEQERAGKFCVREPHKASLRDILRYSLFNAEEDLLKEIDAINMTGTTGATGTRIIIWTLRRTSSGKTEFDFTKDRYDIQIPYHEPDAQKQLPGISKHPSSTPESEYSLRAYCSILYLKPRMQIIIRGQKVKTQLISKSLAFIIKDYYKPIEVKKRIPITFGYNTKSKEQYGIMMYHKNRLIQAYKRVGCQDKANINGVGVIGVIECNFLDPTHNKQDFDRTESYRKTIYNLGKKLEDYWKEIKHKRNKENPNNKPVEDTVKRPDQNWAQCDDCLQWRKLPDGIDCDRLPETWYCRMNPDPQYRSCKVPQESEDSDDDQPCYQKTYKIQEKEDKFKEEQKRKQLEEEKRHQEVERIKKQVVQDLKKKMAVVQSPSTPETGRSRFNLSKPQGGAAGAEYSHFGSPILAQDACSPSSRSTPIISSLPTSTPSRGKRPPYNTPRRQVLPKRPKMTSSQSGGGTNGTLEEVNPGSSMPAPIVVVEDDDDETDITDDDDILIVDASSTPIPKRSSVDLSKVKIERETSNPGVGDAADNALEPSAIQSNSAATADVATVFSPAGQHQNAIATQTEGVRVKEEQERPEQSQHQGNGNESNVAVGQHRDNVAVKPEGRSSGPTSVRDAQEQLAKLQEDMRITAEERDSLRMKVQTLTRMLSQKEEAPSQATIKAVCASKGSQTKETGERENIKSLYEEAVKRADELSREKEAASQQEKENNNEIKMLIQSLDQSTKDKEELGLKVARLEEEKNNLSKQFDEFKLSVEQQREDAERELNSCLTECCPIDNNPEETGQPNDRAANFAATSLVELRLNVARLLASRHIPELDLNQVNFECNVIDELLDQLLSGEENAGAVV